KISAVMACFLMLTGCIVHMNNINIPAAIQPLEEHVLSGEGGDKILMMDISGSITDQGKKGMFSSSLSPVARIKEELDKAASDSAVRAVILRINSPGGTVTASDMIYNELLSFKRKTNKKIIVSITNLGASGAYYIAMAADRIFVHPTTVTGSIGVIMVSMNASGLLEKIGVSGHAIKSGEHKDMGSPFRPMTEEDRMLFQEIIDEMYARFVDVVEGGRPNLSRDEILRAADGRVYTGQQALELGLVDEVGYIENAIESAKARARIKNARVVRYIRPGEYKENIYAGIPGGKPTVNLINLDMGSLVEAGVPQFLYMWLPNN
ncbi:MAG TPA: signal peptide peptidase SppA, partial [Nitrospiria bacterium]